VFTLNYYTYDFLYKDVSEIENINVVY